MGRHARAGLTLGLLAFMIAATEVAAQQAKPSGAELFDSITPLPQLDEGSASARALGLGQAFIAVADDATAALSNPAGLTILRRPEVAIHGRFATYDRPVVLADAEQVLASVNRFRSEAAVLPAPALLAGPSVTRFEADVASPVFVGGVYPLRNWVLALHYREAGYRDGSAEIVLDDAFFSDFYRVSRNAEASVWSLGASGAYQVNSELSVGLTLARTRVEYAVFDELQVDYFEDLEFRTSPAGFDHVDVRLVRSVIDDGASALTLGFGLLYSPAETFDFGAVFRSSGSSRLEGRRSVIRCLDFPGAGNCDPAVPATYVVDPQQSFTRSTGLPDVLGVGAAWRPIPRLTLAADLERRTYASTDALSASELAGSPIEAAVVATLEPIDAAVNLELGAEYEIPRGSNRSPLYIRGGLFTEPDHDGSRRIDGARVHLTVGAGLEIAGVGIDVAGHFADDLNEALVSLVYRFRRNAPVERESR